MTTFTLAIDRPTKGEDKKTDFPKVTVWGALAENCDRFLEKGRLVAVQGRLQTGSYEKDGSMVYTTDVVADRVEFLEWGEPKTEPKAVEEPTPEGFAAVDEQIPF